MKICYFTLTQTPPPRDIVYLDGLKQNGVQIIECRDNTPGFAKFLRLYKKHKQIRGQYDVMFVGYTAHILVPFALLISSKKVVFNALCSLYEGIIVSRGQGSPFSFRGMSCWLIDFLAFNMADLSLLESQEQIKYVSKKFFVSPKKLLKSWTGVDDSAFFINPNINKLPVFTVLFRGAFLPESGIEYAIEAAKILKDEDIKFRIIGSGMMYNKVSSLLKTFDHKNIEWLKDRLTPDELNRKIQECHLGLGQLSNHERLIHTIPHKAFESISLKLPYLTARSKGVLELLSEGQTCFCCNPADAEDLAKKIVELKNNSMKRDEIVDNAYQLYLRELTPKILAKKFMDTITH